MTAKDLEKALIESAKEFGIDFDKDSNRKNAIHRSNIKDESFSNQSAYFGFINPEEDYSGAYSDLSFVIFPQKDGGECVMSIGVGSLGYKNDLELASLPGLRRSYLRLMNDDGNSFCKTSFLDIESTAKDLVNKVRSDFPELKGVIETYKTVLLANRIVNPDTDMHIIKAWLAKYAEYRGWASNNNKRKAIKDALKACEKKEKNDDYKNIETLLKDRKYIVLQGAPGTGKTYSALKIAENFKKTFFTQFHAETTYSDFVYGIQPKLDASTLSYEAKKGILYEAIECAKSNPKEQVLLIIDEINRANLSNVLGPVFYLFEYQRSKSQTIKIGNEEIDQLPQNLYVIATMNTADRSLAVVDFALRRRFSWYTLYPQVIEDLDTDKIFHKDLFNTISDLFDKYANDDELNLQPGQSYFITNKENAENLMKERLIYEIMPLMKEYFAEGYLLKAKDEFSNFFYNETKIQMYL